MRFRITHKGVQISSVCNGQDTQYTVVYQEHKSVFTAKVDYTPFSIVKIRIERELNAIRSSHMDTFTKQDVHDILELFINTYNIHHHACIHEGVHADH